MNESVTFMNTLLPSALLCAAAYVLPWLYVPRETRSQKVTAIAVISAGGTVQLLAMLIFGYLYADAGFDVAYQIEQNPWGTLLYFADLADLSMILWVPTLLLSWFYIAQRVERLRGEDMMRVEIERDGGTA